VLACLRHAPVRRGWVDTLSRGLRPLATFCDPFGIVDRVPSAKRRTVMGLGEILLSWISLQ